MKTTVINTFVDVVGSLASDSLIGNLYLLDNNKASGSLDECTDVLKTMVNAGDELIWMVQSLEPEAYVGITDILIDSAYCVPEMRFYPGTDVAFWTGKVKQDLVSLPYRLKIKVGNRDKSLLTVNTPYLIGRDAECLK